MTNSRHSQLQHHLKSALNQYSKRLIMPQLWTLPQLDRSTIFLLLATPRLTLTPTSYTDNCDLSCGIEIRWRIDLEGGTAIPSTTPSTYNTGQPSTYGSDIQFLGDGVTFNNVVHTITYWIVDCNGNVSDPQTTTITVTPRPEVIKLN